MMSTSDRGVAFRRYLVGLAVAVCSLAVFAAPWTAKAKAPAWGIADLKNPRVTLRSFYSDALKQRRRYVVYLPPGYHTDLKARYPVIYLLHGLGGKGANWFDPTKGALHVQLDTLIGAKIVPPLIAIAPDGGSGYWTDHVGKPDRRFGKYVSHDVVAHVDIHLRTLATRESRAVAGASMGGHGALSIVLMNPQRFGAAVSVAGALFPSAPTHRKVYGKVWGKPLNLAHWRSTGPMPLMAKLPPSEVTTTGNGKAGATTPRIYLSCGTKDGLGFAVFAQKAAALLARRKVVHTLELVPGQGHNWRMFGPNAAQWLPWLADGWRQVGLKASAP